MSDSSALGKGIFLNSSEEGRASFVRFENLDVEASSGLPNSGRLLKLSARFFVQCFFLGRGVLNRSGSDG